MALQLGTGKKRAPESVGPVLSPKIVTSVARKFQFKNGPHQEVDYTLSLYLQGIVPTRKNLRRALRRLQFPVQLALLDVRLGGSLAYDEDLASTTEQYVHHLADSLPVKTQPIYLGLGRVCLVLDAAEQSEVVCAEAKKIARAQGCEVNIGISETVEDAKALVSAARQAQEVAHLGELLWGKPYMYRSADIGVVSALSAEPGLRQHALSEAEQVIAALAKPKNLLPTLKSFFAHNMSPTEVARANKIHRNTVIYRLEKIKDQTGLDPLDFNDATQLCMAISLHETKSLTKHVCAAPQGASMADALAISLFCGSHSLSDEKIRQALSSVGYTLPKEFYCYLVEGSANLGQLAAEKIVFHIAVSDQYSLVLADVQGRRALQLAERFAADGKVERVVYVGSRQLENHYHKALVVLLRDMQLAEKKWPGKKVVADSQLVGYLALLDSKSLNSYAASHAQSVMTTIRATRQLDKTVLALLDSSLNLTLAAKRLKVHRNTLIYRVGRIKHQTGYDMTNFEDALQVRLAWLLAA